MSVEEEASNEDFKVKHAAKREKETDSIPGHATTTAATATDAADARTWRAYDRRRRCCWTTSRRQSVSRCLHHSLAHRH